MGASQFGPGEGSEVSRGSVAELPYPAVMRL